METKKRTQATVASFTDAWIETLIVKQPGFRKRVASFTDAWIETLILPRRPRVGTVASFTDAWIETLRNVGLYGGLRRIFYRCVD